MDRENSEVEMEMQRKERLNEKESREARKTARRKSVEVWATDCERAVEPINRADFMSGFDDGWLSAIKYASQQRWVEYCSEIPAKRKEKETKKTCKSRIKKGETGVKYITPKHMPYISESIQRVLKETRELAYARGYKAGRGELADPGPIDNAEIKDLILKRGLTATNVIDAVCELNGFVGVGFLTFGDAIGGYIRDKASAGMRSQEFYLNS